VRGAPGARRSDDGFVGVGVDPDARVWSATQLRDLGSCRFRWWVQREWGVRAPDEGAEELTPLLEGRLYHLALAGALHAAVGRRGPDARSAALAALEAAFEAAERAERLDDVVPHWPRLRAEHLAHLRALIEAPDFLPDEHEVVGTEERFAGDWHGWAVQGYVDRIDRTPDGVELIDYKLSGRPPAGARDAELKPTLDLQLPLYVDVAAPALRPGEPVAGAAYLSLRTRARVPARAPGADDLADLLARLRASLAAGFFPPEPDPSVCRLCDLASVCRKGPHLERRPAPYRVPDRGGETP
jgi:RecB family exonuclease